MCNFTRRTILKSILLLSTFFFISCGQDLPLQTESPRQIVTSDSAFSAGDSNDRDSVARTGTSANSSTEDAPSEVALTFINSYVENCNKRKEATGITEWVSSSDLVTQKFKNEFKRVVDEAYQEDPELGLDADPIFDAQDYPDKFVLDSEEGVYLTARGKDWPEFKLKMKVEKATDKWLVDGCGIINIPSDRRIVR
jgi:hypothetical protein